jgi:DNA-binding transcriptional MerR regulator
MRPFKIGELTRRSGCTVKAVRFYEAMALLPRAVRSPAGYRLYTERDLKRLAFIRRVKLMGLPLEKIKDLVVHLGEERCACPRIRPHLEQLIREQLESIATKMDQFAFLRKDLQGFLVKMRRAKEKLPAELWRTSGDGPARVPPRGGRR